MKPIVLWWCALFVGTVGGQAGETIVTTGGKKYEHAEVSRIEPDGLVLTTEEGILKVKFTHLSKELQDKYGYDAAKAAAFAKTTAAQQVELARQNAEAATKAAAMKDAALVASEEAAAAENALKQVKDQAVRGVLTVKQVFKDGALAAMGVRVVKSGELRITNPATVVQDSGDAYIEGLNDVVDGDQRELVLYPAGRFQYEAVSGKIRTVRAYAVSAEAALKRASGKE
jgi:hypothetical protein